MTMTKSFIVVYKDDDGLIVQSGLFPTAVSALNAFTKNGKTPIAIGEWGKPLKEVIPKEVVPLSISDRNWQPTR